MATWTAYIKETTTRRLCIEVEADDWETAEEMARSIADSTPEHDWSTDDDRMGYQIDVEEE